MGSCPFTDLEYLVNCAIVTAKTLIFEDYVPKSPNLGLKPRFFALKLLNLYPEKWLVLAVFSDDPV